MVGSLSLSLFVALAGPAPADSPDPETPAQGGEISTPVIPWDEAPPVDPNTLPPEPEPPVDEFGVQVEAADRHRNGIGLIVSGGIIGGGASVIMGAALTSMTTQFVARQRSSSPDGCIDFCGGLGALLTGVFMPIPWGIGFTLSAVGGQQLGSAHWLMRRPLAPTVRRDTKIAGAVLTVGGLALLATGIGSFVTFQSCPNAEPQDSADLREKAGRCLAAKGYVGAAGLGLGSLSLTAGATALTYLHGYGKRPPRQLSFAPQVGRVNGLVVSGAF